MIKVNDIIKYKTYENPAGNWGKVVCIFEIKDSANRENIGKIFVRTEPIENGITHNDVPVEDILIVYKRHFLTPIKDALEFEKSMNRVKEILEKEHRKELRT